MPQNGILFDRLCRSPTMGVALAILPCVSTAPLHCTLLPYWQINMKSVFDARLLQDSTHPVVSSYRDTYINSPVVPLILPAV